MTANIQAAIEGEARQTRSRGVLLGPLSILARQRKTWSPVLLAGVLWRAIRNIGRHRKILEFLQLPAYAELAHADPRFAFKYLTSGYLARRFTVAERAACFTHHYRSLHEKLPSAFLQQILRRDATLVEMEKDGLSLAITFGLSRTHDKEGELSLNLVVEGECVFIVSFTVVPGRVVRSQAAEVLLISRIQGVKGCYRLIAQATRALHNVAPAALLVAALQGVGEALGIGTLGCIRAADQNSYSEDCAALLESAYDGFFSARGVKQNAAGIYLSSIPLPEKPMAQIKPGHKLRTREKRAFKFWIASQASHVLSARRQGQRLPGSLVQPSAVLVETA